MINVSYASNDAFAWLTGVSIYSLLKNNSNENFRLFILDNKISEESKDKIRKICQSFNAELNFIELENLKTSLKGIKIPNRWDFASLGRLFETFLLPASIEKILYIDGDTIILGSVKSLYEDNYDNYAVAGVKDAMSKHYFNNIGITHDDYMFNAGILVLNLKFMRENNIINRFLNKLSTSKNLLFFDQDIINSCIYKNEKKVLPLEYNLYSLCTYCTYKEINTIRKPCNYYSKDEYEKAKTHPVILHLCTCILDHGRPWNEFNNHPYRDIFLSYLNETPFADHKLIMNKKSKSTKIINFLPRFISFRIIGFFHSFIRPIFKRNK